MIPSSPRAEQGAPGDQPPGRSGVVLLGRTPSDLARPPGREQPGWCRCRRRAPGRRSGRRSRAAPDRRSTARAPLADRCGVERLQPLGRVVAHRHGPVVTRSRREGLAGTVRLRPEGSIVGLAAGAPSPGAVCSNLWGDHRGCRVRRVWQGPRFRYIGVALAPPHAAPLEPEHPVRAGADRPRQPPPDQRVHLVHPCRQGRPRLSQASPLQLGNRSPGPPGSFDSRRVDPSPGSACPPPWRSPERPPMPRPRARRRPRLDDGAKENAVLSITRW